jgi:TRAP-type uncharacterized transport system substrate-binding protein
LELMKRHTLLYVLAGIFALFATGFALNWAQNRPTLITIAVGPAASETDRVIRAFERSFSNERSSIRFRIVQTSDAADSAKALDAGKAQFAVLRSDSDISETGQTVAILNRRPVVIVSRRTERIEGFVDLARKRVGLVRVTDSSRALFEKIAQSFDFQADTINAIEVPAAQAGEALLLDRVDALFLVAPTGSSLVSTLMVELGRELGDQLRIVGVEGAQGLAVRFVGIEPAEVPQGAFGGTPARPMQTLSTVAIGYRIAARRDVSASLVADVARAIDDARITLARDLPLALRIEIPEPSANFGLPVHPGATAYLDGESFSFFDVWGDMVLYGMWGLSMVVSALVAGAGLFSRRKREDALKGIDGLVGLVDAVKIAPDIEGLDRLEDEADTIFRTAISAARSHLIDADALTAYRLGIDEVRRLIADRRADLQRMTVDVARAAARRKRGPVAV